MVAGHRGSRAQLSRTTTRDLAHRHEFLADVSPSLSGDSGGKCAGDDDVPFAVASECFSCKHALERISRVISTRPRYLQVCVYRVFVGFSKVRTSRVTERERRHARTLLFIPVAYDGQSRQGEKQPRGKGSAYQPPKTNGARAHPQRTGFPINSLRAATPKCSPLRRDNENYK